MTWKKHMWVVFTASLILTCTVAALNFPRSPFLTAFGDITQLLLVAIAAGLMAANAVSSRGHARGFWLLMAAGCCLWTASLGAWTFFEVVRGREVPEPFFGDVILFIHIVPFMTAVALRPHRPQEEKKLYFSTLNFLMLLIWWVFLYAFTVFPNQYVMLNSAAYNQNYDLLYLFENLVLLVVLGLLTTSVQGPWKKIYWNLFIAAGLYTWSSEEINAAITRGQYYTGSWYDIPLVTSMSWFILAGLMARDLKPAQESAASPPSSKWLALSPRLAMAAILSLPLMGFWSQFRDPSPAPIRHFRLLVTLAAMMVLGGFVFLRQYVLDRELMRLLEESRQSLESLKRLQTQLVQKEKLASLGQLVSGAAHEINNPVAAILGYSELLAANKELDPAQVTMAQKIGHQARRTRDLLSGLLSFAQQAPAEKSLLEIGPLLQRALQMKMLQMETKGIRVHTTIAPVLPPVWGSANQLMQCFLEIIGNSMDAMQATGGGTLWVSVRCEDDVLLKFSDSGPGILEPQRVFDPFYTTKSVGKGTGLGLSATYGVVQDHGGQISCHNRPEGGAVFVLRIPIARPESPAAKPHSLTSRN
jgi:signal transduction histidine kinase